MWERRAGAFTAGAMPRIGHPMSWCIATPAGCVLGTLQFLLFLLWNWPEVVGLPWSKKSLTWIWGLMWIHGPQEFRREAVGVLERGPVYLFLIQFGKLWFCPLGNNFAAVCPSPQICVVQGGRGCLQDICLISNSTGSWTQSWVLFCTIKQCRTWHMKRSGWVPWPSCDRLCIHVECQCGSCNEDLSPPGGRHLCWSAGLRDTGTRVPSLLKTNYLVL